MPTYLSPGVYVKEVSGGAKPIAGVGTSTGAFVGMAEKGIIHKAVLVTNWTQFVKEFGSFFPDGYLAYGVFSFFSEGGTSCYVVRAAIDLLPEDACSSATFYNEVEPLATPDEVLKVTLIGATDEPCRIKGTWGDRINIDISDPLKKDSDSATHFKLTVTFEDEKEVFDNITISDVADKINGISELIEVNVLPSSPDNTQHRPANISKNLSGGDNGIVSDLQASAEYIGTEADKKGLHAFDEVDDINIVAIPDGEGNRDVIQGALTYCKDRGDCFFIADPSMELFPTNVKDFKNATGTYSDQNAFNSSYGALYYPWVYINDPLTGKNKLIPPSGAVAGTYAYTDSARGVHKAPAGIAEGYLDSVVGIESIITKGEHDLLNPAGINVIRSLPAGICIWGARTLSADPEWQYVNVRRLLLYIEESVDEGTQWVVFEPNDPTLWGTVKRNITAFLLRVWRDGALFGSTPDEAFFVKVDAENNPPEVRDAGQLIIEVGVAPVKPAEFVIIKISQKTLTK